ncbi:MAG TPA: hypothetical protein VMX54_15005 [Vicinamibacteria bacterium]|nr:hypothetical protein [Vicinamibacteria bacterium]
MTRYWSHWSRKQKLAAFVPLFLAGGALFVAVGGEVVKLLWNAVLPPLFGWPQVGFWQALGLLILCRILFGGLGHGGGGGRSPGGRRLAAHWARMSAEERERFRQALRDRGLDPTTGEPSPGESSPR